MKSFKQFVTEAKSPVDQSGVDAGIKTIKDGVTSRDGYHDPVDFHCYSKRAYANGPVPRKGDQGDKLVSHLSQHPNYTEIKAEAPYSRRFKSIDGPSHEIEIDGVFKERPPWAHDDDVHNVMIHGAGDQHPPRRKNPFINSDGSVDPLVKSIAMTDHKGHPIVPPVKKPTVH